MSIVSRGLRSLFVWAGPVLVLLIAVGSGFVYWCLATEPGTRWTLETAASQFDGYAKGVEGSLWAGVRVQDMAIALPQATVRMRNFHMKAHWPELSGQLLHVNDLSVQTLDVDVLGASAPASTEPFKMPVIPLRVALDRLAIGELRVRQDGKPLPLGLRDLNTSLSLSGQGAQLDIKSLELSHEALRFSTQGRITLLALDDPWPIQARLTTHAVGQGSNSPLCMRRFVPTLPVAKGAAASDAECALDIESTLDGSLDSLKVVLAGSSQGVSLDADATLSPRAAFPLKNAMLDLKLADGSSLAADVDWNSSTVDGVMHDHLTGTVHSKQLDVGQLVGSAIPPAVITTSIAFDARLLNHRNVLSADLDIDVGKDSRWNKQPLSGVLKVKLDNAGADPAATAAVLPDTLRLADLAMDVRLGKNRLRADGSLGAADSRLNLDMLAPQLAAFWPGIPGGVTVQGRISGSLAKHAADLKAAYTPDRHDEGRFATAATEVQLGVAGGWGVGPDASGVQGWRGVVSKLAVKHGGLNVTSETPVTLAFLPEAKAPAWQWQVGAASMRVALPSYTGFVIRHQASRGGPGRWETQGAVDKLVVSQALITALQKEFDPNASRGAERGGVNIRNEKKADPGQIVLALDWNLKLAGVLEGQAHIKRVSGDLMVPGDPGFPLGLRALTIDLAARRASASASRISADVNIVTAKMGRVAASGTTLLGVAADGSFKFDKNEPKTLAVDADIDDLGWASLFLGDAMELGGSVQARLKAQSGVKGTWAASGTITGQKIRLVRIDDGVRLLDGTLAAHVENDRFVLDSLRFPALLRVTPKEWRTNEWVTTNPDAKNGSLTLSGAWNLLDSAGVINVDLVRYPILQRSDRYAMATGKLKVDVQPPKIAITGNVTADAGWFDLDMLGGIPTVDSDVVVIRPGEAQKVEVPTDISMDLTVDLGPRFYLTGYGVNSGLVGRVRIIMAQGKLTGEGALRTRGGAIEVYGQRLQLRRGTITFQGDIASPVLNIEALRTGGAVEAGVRVAGTAKRPRIDLVSYPDVSDVEKLSWLLLGRPPDEGGGDAALLFSVGTSLLGSGEPFYRKFGLDEVSIRSGALGATGSILPVESVVSGLDSGTSDIERKFITAGKTLSSGITLSIEQALSDTGTVGRASYKLARGLTAEFSLGTVTGLALIYRVFSKD